MKVTCVGVPLSLFGHSDAGIFTIELSASTELEFGALLILNFIDMPELELDGNPVYSQAMRKPLMEFNCVDEVLGITKDCPKTSLPNM